MSILRSASLISKSDFLRDRQHGDGCGRSVDAPLGLGRRHALHPMDAALELEPGENAAARHFGDDLLEPPGRPLARRQNFDLPALPLGVFDVHAEQVAGEQGCFVPARARPDFDDCAALVGGVLGQERNLNRPWTSLPLRLRRRQARLRPWRACRGRDSAPAASPRDPRAPFPWTGRPRSPRPPAQAR